MLWYHNSDYDLVDVLHAALLVWLVALPEEVGAAGVDEPHHPYDQLMRQWR